MKGLIKLREGIHHRILTLRSFEHAMSQPQFDRLWDSSPDAVKEKLCEIIDKVDKKGLKDWMGNHPSLDLGELSIHKLRKIAQRMSVLDYSRMDKGRLVAAITEREEDYGTKQD